MGRILLWADLMGHLVAVLFIIIQAHHDQQQRSFLEEKSPKTPKKIFVKERRNNMAFWDLFLRDLLSLFLFIAGPKK